MSFIPSLCRFANRECITFDSEFGVGHLFVSLSSNPSCATRSYASLLFQSLFIKGEVTPHYCTTERWSLRLRILLTGCMANCCRVSLRLALLARWTFLPLLLATAFMGMDKRSIRIHPQCPRYYFRYLHSLIFEALLLMRSLKFCHHHHSLISVFVCYCGVATDLTPNVGLFWYYFTEAFTHFRPFFIFLFQYHVLVYVIPLTIRFR